MTRAPLRLAIAAMGTRFELAIAAGRGDLLAAGEAALEEIEGLHGRLSRFAPDSLLSHINRTAWRAPVRLDRETFDLFAEALNVCTGSEGAFDITVAPAMARAGFADSAVTAATGRADAAGVRLDPRSWTIALAGPHVSLDLGGIAKGHAIDCAARTLREAGVTRAVVHGGTSTVAVIGAPAGARAWRIALDPSPGAPVIDLRDAALSVSDAASQITGTGQGHIIDPRSGTAIRAASRAAVSGPSARLADAWSTALSVLRRIPPAFPPGYVARLEPDSSSSSERTASGDWRPAAGDSADT